MSVSHKKMSVLIHQDGLSFFIYSALGVEEYVTKSFKHASNPIEILNEITMMYEHEKCLNHPFEEVTLVYLHSIFTGVPSSIYDKNHESDYLKYNTRLLDTDIISADESIKSLDYKSIYIAYSNINNYFFERYGDFNYYHYSTLALMTHYKEINKQGTEMILDIKESDFYLTIFNNGVLKLHNSYPQQAAEDILYYTLFTAQHNDIDLETVLLKIIAPVKDDHIFDLLYTYVRHVNYDDNSNKYLETILCV